MTKPGLDAAYGAGGAQALEALYRDWADTYDDAFAADRGYRLPCAVADKFARLSTPSGTPVLDVGAGTGLVGDVLTTKGGWVIDALDPSTPMLKVAKKRGVYRSFHAVGLGNAPTGYGGVLSAGTFTHGHLGPDMLAPLLACLKPRGLAVISVNEAHYNATGFANALEKLPISGLQTARTLIYIQNIGDEHDNDTALIVSFRKAG